MDFGNMNLRQADAKPAFDAQLDDLLGEDDSAGAHYNPMLDDTDEVTSTPAPVAVETVTAPPPAQLTAVADAPSRPWERNRTLQETADLDARAAAGELLPGRKKKTPYSFGWVTTKDLAKLWQIAFGRYVKDVHLQVAAGLKSNTGVYSRLRAMEKAGLVRAQHKVGAGQLWTITRTGMRVLEFNGVAPADSFSYVGPGDISGLVEHTLAVNFVVAQMVVGGVYDLGPDHGGMSPVPHSQLVSELTISSSWSTMTAIKKDEKPEKRFELAAKLREYTDKLVGENRLSMAEALRDTPALWVPFYAPRREYDAASGRDWVRPGSSHMPDLVIAREGIQRASIAVEVELSPKNGKDYARILEAYAGDRGRFAAVLWFASDSSVANALRKAIEKGGAAGRKHRVMMLQADALPLLLAVPERDRLRAAGHRKRAMPKSKTGFEAARNV